MPCAEGTVCAVSVLVVAPMPVCSNVPLCVCVCVCVCVCARARAQGHNRYWSNETTYSTAMGGPFQFLSDPTPNHFGRVSLPTQQEFWDYLLQVSKRWGLTTYEQARGLRCVGVPPPASFLCPAPCLVCVCVCVSVETERECVCGCG